MRLAPLILLLFAGCGPSVSTPAGVIFASVAKSPTETLTPRPKVIDPPKKPSITEWLADLTPAINLEAVTEAAHHNELWHEARIADAWRAAGIPTETEVHTADNARCDLVTGSTAYELDWAHKWAECGGQAAFYAKELKRKPGMILLAEDGDEKFVERAEVVAKLVRAELIVVPVEGDVPLPTEKASAAASPEEQPVGYDFFADWCVPCRETTPIVEAFRADGLRIETIDADAPENAALMAKYRIMALPTFVKLLPDGRFTKLVGRQSKESLAAFYGFTPNHSPDAGKMVASAKLLTATPRVYTAGGYGSGTVIEPGRLLTCAHVMVDELTGEYRAPVRIVWGDTMAPAEIIGHVSDNRGNDLALLSFDAEKYPAAVIPVAESVADANAIFTTHGYPYGKSQIQERRINLWNARRGMNGQQELANPEQRFASQAFIQGESGGGITDASGKLVGVIAATDGRMGYVVSHEAIKAFLADTRGGE